MKRNALVLSGGGAKGSFQIGVLEHLIKRKKIDFEIICGISVGALNASYLAQAKFEPENPELSIQNLQDRFDSLKHFWFEEIKGDDNLYETRFGKYLGVVLGADSIYKPSPLEKVLKGNSKPDQLSSSGRRLKIGYVSLESGEYKSADENDPRIVDHVMASVSIPFFFPPVKVAGESLVDGGLRDITPLGLAFKEKPDEIYTVYSSPFYLEKVDLKDNWLGTKVSVIDIIKRSAEVILDEIYQTDVKLAKMFNIVLRSWNAVRESTPEDLRRSDEFRMLEKMKFCPIHEFIPERYIIRDALNFSPRLIRENFNHGKEVAEHIFP